MILDQGLLLGHSEWWKEMEGHKRSSMFMKEWKGIEGRILILDV